VLRAPRLARGLGLTWQDLCNRHESLAPDPLTGGRVCRWEDSSPLTVARFDPRVGGRLLAHCLREWPIGFSDAAVRERDDEPAISVIIGVRGTGRLPQFLCCLAALRAQRGVAVEVLVVEQSWQREFETLVPAGVRYLHQQCTHPAMPYNRAWAFNAGARAARGRILVLHDADMLVPAAFAEAIGTTIARGLDAVRLPRLLFYLDRAASETIQRGCAIPADLRIERIIANNRTPVAVTREAYERIGGHDESFYGWGAEDDEFMDRLRTLRLGAGAFLPIVHLWHPAAPTAAHGRNAALLAARRASSAEARIAELRRRAWGATVPAVAWTPETAAATLDAA
jgi:hypothetical protein